MPVGRTCSLLRPMVSSFWYCGGIAPVPPPSPSPPSSRCTRGDTTTTPVCSCPCSCAREGEGERGETVLAAVAGLGLPMSLLEDCRRDIRREGFPVAPPSLPGAEPSDDRRPLVLRRLFMTSSMTATSSTSRSIRARSSAWASAPLRSSSSTPLRPSAAAAIALLMRPFSTL